MFLQKRTRWKLAYPPDYKGALAFSIVPYLHCIVPALRQAYRLQQRSTTGLPRSVQITGLGYLPAGEAGVLPIYRKLIIHVLVANVLASWLHPFWSECVSNFHSFAA
jgi:hypothetical protein